MIRKLILDPSSNKYCDLIGQKQVSISIFYKFVKISYKLVNKPVYLGSKFVRHCLVGFYLI